MHFYKNRFIFFAISLFLIIGGAVYCFVNGVNLDIEFKGGSVVEYDYSGEIDLERSDELISSVLGQSVSVQKTQNIGDQSTRLIVSVAGDDALSTDQRMAMTDALNKEYPSAHFEISSSQLVNPIIGREMLMNGLLAMVIAGFLIIAYVWYSFRKMSGPSAGVMALVALLHDIIITSFAFIIWGAAVNETLIAVVLTILGFSINDTIVIYDRIRENIRLTKGSEPLEDLVDRSIKQSLARSIMTSVCMFIAVIIAYIFAVAYGLQSIQEFALPISVGIISGTYSSICIAGPLWVSWKKRGGRTGYES